VSLDELHVTDVAAETARVRQRVRQWVAAARPRCRSAFALARHAR
jgi:hypothetical protein